MNVERRVQLWTYAKFAGMFFVGILFAVLAQAVAQTTNAEDDEEKAEKGFVDCLESTSTLLSARQQALVRRENDIHDKEKNIREAKENLQDQIDELKKIRLELDVKMKDMDAKKMEKVKALVARFEKVRAKQAAAILEKTDDDVSILVLEEMNAAKSGKILAAMNADKAAYLTERLAQHPIKKGEKPEKGK